MKYFSTRGGPERLSFEETVLTGLAPNGGLFIPAELPQLPANWQTEWRDYTFQQLSTEILSLFISDSEISRPELEALVDKSYSSTFKSNLPSDPVTPIVQVEKDKLYILELFHGPTFAFKDVALQFLGNLFEFFLMRRNKSKKEGETRERLTVVGATSGDTGSAAIYGLRGKKDINIFILHPKGRVSPIQEAQMTTVTDENVYNLAVKGTFDDCQDIVKFLFADQPFNNRFHLGAINSINWARILAQIVYYFSSYFQLLKALNLSASEATSKGVQLQYCVPTGNFGDILAGWYAKQLGLPMANLVVATNENDILQRFWSTGVYEKAASSASSNESDQTDKVQGSSDGAQATSAGGVKATLSPAMDILVSSNFERLLWYYASQQVGVGEQEKAGQKLKGWMDDLKKVGKVSVGQGVHEAAKKEFSAQRVSDKEIKSTLGKYFEASPSYVADPHTAVGLAAAERERQSNPATTVQVVLATAHPAKFSEAVEASLSSHASFNFDRDVLPDAFRGLLEKERRVIDVAGPEPELTKQVIEKHLGHLFEKVKASEQEEQTLSV